MYDPILMLVWCLLWATFSDFERVMLKIRLPRAIKTFFAIVTTSKQFQSIEQFLTNCFYFQIILRWKKGYTNKYITWCPYWVYRIMHFFILVNFVLHCALYILWLLYQRLYQNIYLDIVWSVSANCEIQCKI